MRTLGPEQILEPLIELIISAARCLPPDVLQALHAAHARESSPQGREVLAQLLANAQLAGQIALPLCQDTGSSVFFAELGQDLHISAPGLPAILEQAVSLATSRAHLRASICHPFSRANTGDNTPVSLHLELVSGDKLRIVFLPKGGGAENMSRLTMLSPAQGREGVIRFATDCVAEAGPNPCPPIIVGVGVGGGFDAAPTLAKKALLLPLDQVNPDPEAAELEADLYQRIQTLGIGPGGLGGDCTCLGVRCLIKPCHIASLPVAVNIQCNSARRGEIVF